MSAQLQKLDSLKQFVRASGHVRKTASVRNILDVQWGYNKTNKVFFFNLEKYFISLTSTVFNIWV